MSSESKVCFQDCDVCCSQSKKHIKCVYCAEKACEDCYETYLLDQHQDKCMFCNKNWSFEFMQTNFRHTFINGKYKEKKKVLMFEREKSLLPATQTELAEEEKRLLLQQKSRVLNNRIKMEESNFKQYSRIARSMQSTLKQQEEALELMREFTDKIRKLREKHRDIFHQLYPGADPFENAEAKRPERVVKALTIPCTKNDCRGYVVVEDSKFACGMCKAEHCKKCHCEKDDEHKCDPNVLETVKLLANDTKPCPKCQVPIFKIAGCDQMFCTSCHTAFSWNTGHIETGHIHNPHYWEYLNRQGRDLDGVRNMMGIRQNNCLTLEETVRDVRSELYADLCQRIMHMRHGTVQQQDDIDANKDIRKRYLKKEIDEKGFKMVLYKREKKKKFNVELTQILNMMYDASKDMLIMLYIKHFVETNDRMPKRRENFSKELPAVVSEIRDLCKYTEEQVEKLCERFEYKQPQYVVTGIKHVRDICRFTLRKTPMEILTYSRAAQILYAQSSDDEESDDEVELLA